MTDSISYTLAPDMNIGTSFRYILKCNNGLYTFRDTVTKYFGPPLQVFSDDCNAVHKLDFPEMEYYREHLA